MEFKMKKSSKWVLLALIPVMAACGSQGSQVSNDLAIPVSVADVVKKSIVQYINTTGTATAASQVTLYTEMAGSYNLNKNPRTGGLYKLGDIVEKGEVIVKLENPETQNSIAIDTKKLNLEI